MTTTQAIDFIPIIHDLRLTIRESPVQDGLATVTLPAGGATLFLSDLKIDQLADFGEKFKSLEREIRSLSLPFQKKELVLEPKQMLYLVDATTIGKRREFVVQVLGEEPPKQQGPAAGGKRR